MSEEQSSTEKQLTLGKFNEINYDALHTLGVHYFAEILKENERLKNQLNQRKYLCSWVVHNKKDFFPERLVTVIVPADSKRKAINKLLKIDTDGCINDLIQRISDMTQHTKEHIALPPVKEDNNDEIVEFFLDSEWFNIYLVNDHHFIAHQLD